MAHGAGGKATRKLVEGLLAPAFGMTELGDAATVGRARADHRRVRGQAAALPGRLDRRARGQRHGQRPRHGRGAAARAQPRADPRGGAHRGRPARRGRGDRPGRRGGRRVRSSPATPRWSSAATPTGCTSCTTGLGRRDPRAQLRRRPRPGDRILLSGAVGEHGTAIMLARGEFDLDADIVSDTRSLWPAVDALLDAGGVRALRDATRGGVASVLNELAAGVGDGGPRGGRAGQAGRCRRLRAAGHRPAVRGQRGQVRGARGAGARGRGARPRCERFDPDAAEIGEVRAEPPGMVLVETSVRRPAGDGRAGRGPAAADLLMHELSIADAHRWRSPSGTRTGGDSRASR